MPSQRRAAACSRLFESDGQSMTGANHTSEILGNYWRMKWSDSGLFSFGRSSCRHGSAVICMWKAGKATTAYGLCNTVRVCGADRHWERGGGDCNLTQERERGMKREREREEVVRGRERTRGRRKERTGREAGRENVIWHRNGERDEERERKRGSSEGERGNQREEERKNMQGGRGERM